MSMVDRRAIVYFDVDTLELIVRQPMPDQIARFVILKKKIIRSNVEKDLRRNQPRICNGAIRMCE